MSGRSSRSTLMLMKARIHQLRGRLVLEAFVRHARDTSGRRRSRRSAGSACLPALRAPVPPYPRDTSPPDLQRVAADTDWSRESDDLGIVHVECRPSMSRSQAQTRRRPPHPRRASMGIQQRGRHGGDAADCVRTGRNSARAFESRRVPRARLCESARAHLRTHLGPRTAKTHRCGR